MSPIANMLIQIKNAQTAAKASVIVPYSNVKNEIAHVLKKNNFVGEVEKKKQKLEKKEGYVLSIELKYNDHEPAIKNVKMISKPSRRVYVSKTEMRPVRGGYGLAVVSTTKGIMTSKEASVAGLGGEVIFEVW